MNAICWNAVLESEPKYSAILVGIAIPVVVLAETWFWKFVPVSVAAVPVKPYGLATDVTPENAVFASL